MFKEYTKEIDWNGHKLTMKTGKVARQADGAVVVSMGDTSLLCTVVCAKEAKENMDFFPLTVNYREMAYAAGKIPGGFLKREGKSSDREVLVSRLIDRPIRPLFPDSFSNDTQIICTVLSYDPKYNPDILAIIGASAALKVSGVPFLTTLAAARVGFADGEFILNPGKGEDSKLDLVLAGSDDSVMMVESEADLLTEDQMLKALEFGHNSFKPVIAAIDELAKEVGKTKWEIPGPVISEESIDKISAKCGDQIKEIFTIQEKRARNQKLKELLKTITAEYTENEEFKPMQIHYAFKQIESRILRGQVLATNIRLDDRKPNTVRQIASETAFLPKAHGSALFTRGETQALVSTTLGSSDDEQMIDGLDSTRKDHFMLHYIFPPYSVGEASPMRGPGRREVGHGKLAWRALKAVMPDRDTFPYTMRIVSEITESNGSSSMATVCGGSLAMMDAGVPLKAPVSGIAMGLIKEGDKFVVLSDISADEDHLGDMDFKVAGSKDGVTALQMDIKVAGINLSIMKAALEQAKEGRLHILGEMAKTTEVHRSEINEHAPRIETLQVSKDKIKDIIGPGGKMIKEICEVSGAKVDINDDGKVNVFAVGSENLNKAMKMIKNIAVDPQIGELYEGKVVKVLASGAFINYLPGRDGFIHISEIKDERIESIEDHLSEDQQVKVKIIGYDNRNKAKLSMRLEADHSQVANNDKDRDAKRPRRTTTDRPKRDHRDHDRNDRRESNNKAEATESDPSSKKYFF